MRIGGAKGPPPAFCQAAFELRLNLLRGAASEITGLRDDVLVLRHVAIRTNFGVCFRGIRRDKARVAAQTAIGFFPGHVVIAHGSTGLADGAVKPFHPDSCQARTLTYVIFVFHGSPPAHGAPSRAREA
jgi:hypothetical protein